MTPEGLIRRADALFESTIRTDFTNAHRRNVEVTETYMGLCFIIDRRMISEAKRTWQRKVEPLMQYGQGTDDRRECQRLLFAMQRAKDRKDIVSLLAIGKELEELIKKSTAHRR